MVFAPELDDEKQNMISFLLGAALKALDRPGGYKEFQQLGFNRKKVIEMLQLFGHNTDQLAREFAMRNKQLLTTDNCLCGHGKADHQYNASLNRYLGCLNCFACPQYLSPQSMRRT